MPFRQWLRSPRRLLGLFLAVMLTLGAALGWLGWRLLEQDRELSSQRIRERLESAADLAEAVLVRRLSEAEDRLGLLMSATDPTAGAPQRAEHDDEDVLTVVMRSEDLEVRPPGHLLYYPVVPAARNAVASVFASGEALEFRQRDYAKAAAAFRELARSSDSAVRAGALLRLARNLRKAGSTTDALAVYDELARMKAVLVEGLPADLVGRHGRCVLLDELKRLPALHDEASAVHADLQRGTWRLTRGAYGFYVQEARRWIQPDPIVETRGQDASALAGGVDWLWDEWQRIRRGEARAAGRHALWIDGRPSLVLWRSSSDRLVSVIGGQGFLERQFGSALTPVMERQAARLTLIDAEGHAVLGEAGGSAPQRAVRSLGETELPWTLSVASANPGADLARLASRRVLLLAAFGVTVLFVFTGSAFILRALTRELEVARLQSDFVAAVSHEFRTPLASLRQLSELLADGRVPSEERRQDYYEGLRRESERLHRLVENLLDFGRMDAGAREYRFEAVEPGRLVSGVAKEFAEQVRQQGYHLEVTANDHLPAVRADREALSRALWNLLDNAVKYSPDSKTIWVEAAREGSQIAIQVRDRGVGIAPDEQQQIFKKFVRAPSAKAAGIKGTGLGLAMVQHIVSAHGGEIRVTSEPGAGSTFTILLPVAGDLL